MISVFSMHFLSLSTTKTRSETTTGVLFFPPGRPEREREEVPEVAELHLEPSLFPAILGFFTYTVGKVGGGGASVFFLRHAVFVSLGGKTGGGGGS